MSTVPHTPTDTTATPTATPTGAKLALLEEYARIAQALAAPARLMLLEQLAQGERGVESLAAKTGLTVANASQHLQMLLRAGLVTNRRTGKAILYRLGDARTLALMDLLRQSAEANQAKVAEILRALADGQDPPEAVSREALQALLDQGAVTVLDMRPADEFAAGHVPGARQVMPADLAALIPSLPAGQPIVAYCRGPYCIYAHQAVAMLRRHGLPARRMEGGLPEWRAEGRPTACLPA